RVRVLAYRLLCPGTYPGLLGQRGEQEVTQALDCPGCRSAQPRIGLIPPLGQRRGGRLAEHTARMHSLRLAVPDFRTERIQECGIVVLGEKAEEIAARAV